MPAKFSPTCISMVFLLGTLIGTFVNTGESFIYKLLVIFVTTVTFHLTHFLVIPKQGSVSKGL
jgi:hypothetical protein